jgi:membrane fusion protein
VVSALQVREGQVVSAGQTVATLTLSSEVEGGDSLAAFSRSLDAQVSATEAGASARLAALTAEQVQLRARSAALARERDETRRALKLQQERLTLARAEVERAQAIADQGFLPRRELEARRSAELAVQQEASTLSGRILSFDREIGEVAARLSAIPIDAAAARASAASAQAGLNQQRTQTEVQGRYAVVSTVAGRVAAMPVEVGQTLAPGATVAVISAGDSRLEAELFPGCRVHPSGAARPADVPGLSLPKVRGR